MRILGILQDDPVQFLFTVQLDNKVGVGTLLLVWRHPKVDLVYALAVGDVVARVVQGVGGGEQVAVVIALQHSGKRAVWNEKNLYVV